MYYFIDFENVHLNGLAGIENLSQEDTVVILFPFSAKQILTEYFMICNTAATIQLHCVSVGYKDALDMKLIVKAMLMYKVGSSKIAFISNDHIFTGIRDALKEFNYLGHLTLAVGTSCADLFRYYCFEYGVYSMFERVSGIFSQKDHDFSEVKDTYRLVERCELSPNNNIRIKGLSDTKNRCELLGMLDAVTEPKCGNELQGIVARDKASDLADIVLPTAKIGVKAPTKIAYHSMKDNIRGDKDWGNAVKVFCYDFLPAVKGSCKLVTPKCKDKLAEVLRKTAASKRSFDTILRVAPGWVGCKEPTLRTLFDAYLKVGVPVAK